MLPYAAAGAVSNSEWAREGIRAVRPFAAHAREGLGDALRDVRAIAAVTSGSGDGGMLKEMRAFAASTGEWHGEQLQPVVNPYIATAGITGKAENGSMVECGYPHVLISFAYDKDHSFYEQKLGYDAPHWMGDSGAHTVWTKGVKIDLAAYIDWCHYYRALKPNFVCISLDVISGEPHRQPTKREVQQAMDESLDNGDVMRAAGLPIMEVFHQGEPWSFLDTILDRRQPGELLGISKRGKLAPKHQIAWLDQVFARLRDRCGWDSLVPCHGLGLAATSPHASRYPWWSVDASSWVASAMYGKEVLPGGRKRGDDTRNSNRELRKLYLIRTLNAWLERERALTRLWHERGVRFSDTPDDVLTPA